MVIKLNIFMILICCDYSNEISTLLLKNKISINTNYIKHMVTLFIEYLYIDTNNNNNNNNNTNNNNNNITIYELINYLNHIHIDINSIKYINIIGNIDNIEILNFNNNNIYNKTNIKAFESDILKYTPDDNTAKNNYLLHVYSYRYFDYVNIDIKNITRFNDILPIKIENSNSNINDDDVMIEQKDICINNEIKLSYIYNYTKYYRFIKTIIINRTLDINLLSCSNK